jgi:hypothetical protein
MPDMGAYENALSRPVPHPFDLVYPFNDTTIVLTRDNFLDTLYFAWNQPVGSKGDELTYKRDLTGDLTDYIKFIVTGGPEITNTDFSLRFDGIDDEVNITGDDFILGNEPRTISVWADGCCGNIVALGDGLAYNERFSIFSWVDRRVLIIGEGNDWDTGYSLPENEMTHLVTTHDGTTTKLYANGIFQGEASRTYNTDSSMPIMIGTNTDNRNDEYFDGHIDEVAIWNDALTDAEITALYNSGSSLDASTNSGNYISSANLKGYWKFNEGAGTSVFDASGNGNDGIIYGADWDTTDSPFMPLVGNMFKIPHHHIEDYMHTAGVEIATGTWDVIASNGESSTSSANGPFTLTINASALSSDETGLVPQEFALHQNYPNPFNPTTTISYDLPEQAQVTLGIYDLLGKQIKTLVNHSQDAGNRITVWDGTDELGRPVSAGVYLYRIKAEEFTQTRKMLLLK